MTRLSRGKLWLGLALPAGTAMLVRVARGYRTFPSVDDFAYLPLARAAIDPSLFPRDAIVHRFVLHAPVWVTLVRVLDPTIGIAAGFWLLTLALSIATVGAVYRLMRALGAAGLLAPVAVLVGLTGRVVGVGRGIYDGAFGDAFHVQWLALCLLLWAYDAWMRGHSKRTGLLLGFAVLAHPVVAFQGATVIGVAALVGGRAAWRKLAATALVTALVSAPFALSLTSRLEHQGALAWPVERIVRDGFLFRAPHGFTFEQTTLEAALVIIVLGLAGLAGLILIRSKIEHAAWRAALGLWLGQGAWLLAAALLYDPGPLAPWSHRHLAPYLLDLTRTSPLFLALAATFAAAALERRGELRGLGGPARELLWLALFAVLLLLLSLFVPWVPALAVALALAAVSGSVRALSSRPGVLATLYSAAAVIGLGWCWTHDQRELMLPPDAQALYAWALRSSDHALFIVPPGMEGFREYARRSIYVDFKLFPASTASAVPEWRERLDLISAPDGAARAAAGWPAVPLWDRSYASRNTPARIADLLRTTGADYFVWDRHGLDVPPYVSLPRDPDPAVQVVYANDRFEVYALAGAAHAAR